MKLRFPIKAKTIIFIVLFAMTLGGISLLICGRVLANTVDRKYREDATNISATVAKVVDAEKVKNVRNKVADIFNSAENRVVSDEWGTDEFYEYIALFDSVKDDEDFKYLLGYLSEIQSVNDVDCLYISYLDVPTESFVYLVDASEEDACPPGCFDPIYDQNKQLLTDPTVGFPAYITNTEAYGWLVTAGTAIYDSEGGVVAYAMVDISMNEIRAEQASNILILFLYLAITTIILIVVIVIIIDNMIIKPIKKLSVSAAGYYTDDNAIEHDEFSKLDFHTGDEISALANSMKKMENDLNVHIKKLLSANTQLSISKSVANRMTELATKDQLTGLRNNTAFELDMKTLNRQIQEGDTDFGIAMIDLNFLKFTNDNYGHESGNAALVSLSRVISEVFAHSPVFRIGGDEFSVILTNDDFANIKELEAEFNNRIAAAYGDETLDPPMRISAAIGYALFDPAQDSSSSDVLNRADKEMYEHKRAMKSSGISPIRP
ncbi:MAG: GGDEF domain-containing protein [Clostridia bacterium]|nr:GGDEF domain-containing protein [Clostridia bacterium]